MSAPGKTRHTSRSEKVRRTSRSGRVRRTSRSENVLRVAIIAFALIVSIGPVWYGIVIAVRPLQSIITNPLDLIPSLDEIDLSSFATAMRDEGNAGFGLGRFVRNSLVLASAAVALSVLTSILGAYAAARLRYKGRQFTSGIILAVYLFPGIVLAVPLFVLLSRVGLTGSLAGLLIVYVALTVPVALYMMRNYFLALPESVEEAAIIDGCSLPQMLFRVVLPIAVPGVAATAIYVFMIAWNEYLFALLFLVQNRRLWTAPLGIAQLTEFSVPVPILLAGSIAVTVPVVLAFFFSQRLLVAGLTAGAEK